MNSFMESKIFVYGLKLVRFCYILLALMGFGLIGYWCLDRSTPVTVYDMGSISSQVARPGDILQVSWIITKKELCPGTSIRTLSGECGAHILRVGEPSGPLLLQPTITRINFTVPEEATNGVCEYRTTIQYYCNPIHYWFPVILDFPVIKFRVIRE